MATFRNDVEPTFVESRDEFEIMMISNTEFHLKTGGALAALKGEKKVIIFSEHYMGITKSLWNALYWHEVGHHRLNHTLIESGPERNRQEAEADLYSARNAGWVSIITMLVWVHTSLWILMARPELYLKDVLIAAGKNIPDNMIERSKGLKTTLLVVAWLFYPLHFVTASVVATKVYMGGLITRLYHLNRLARTR